MKILISPKAISVVMATLTAAIILSSVAPITSAAAQDRLAENPDIHNPGFWRSYHRKNCKIGTNIDKLSCKESCLSLCEVERNDCYVKYEVLPQRDRSSGTETSRAIVNRDCGVLKSQCIAQECARYGG